MPSQEDYLDRLLKEFTNKELVAQPDQAVEATKEPAGQLTEDPPQDPAEKLTEMSEEDVERILQQNQAPAEVQQNQDDLMELLKQSDDQDLTDIHDLLKKSDEDIPVEDSTEEDTVEPGAEKEEIQEDEKELTEFSEKNDKQEMAAFKRKLKEEKKAAKKAAKEAARETAKKVKQEKAAAKQAAKGAKKEAVKEAEKTIEKQPEVVLQSPESVDLSAMDDLLNVGMENPEEIAVGDAEDASVFQSFDEKDQVVSETDQLDNETDQLDNEMDQTVSEMNQLADKTEDVQIPGGEKTKKSFWTRILDFLTEEDLDDDEPDELAGIEDIPMSDENRNILEEMDQEGADNRKKGKKNKKKKKEKKKGKGTNSGENSEDSEESAESEKTKKSQKPKKVKKEKAPRENSQTGEKIPLKRLIPILAASVSVLLVILLFSSLGGEYVVKKQARQAYYKEDYETCYQQLYGKNLTESEQVMYGRSESILRVRLWVREYEVYAQEQDRVRALDVLIQAVNQYPALYEYATKWNAGQEVSEGFEKVTALLEEFGLSIEQAQEIAAIPDDVEYTKAVVRAAAGEGYEGSGTETPVTLPDLLPEEREFQENSGGL